MYINPLILYLQRNIPISAVHAAFTAGIVHLVDAKDPQNPNPNKSTNMLRLLVRSLYKMNIAWFWCNRSIMVIESLAEQLALDLWQGRKDQQVDEASRCSFEKYKQLAKNRAPDSTTPGLSVDADPAAEEFCAQSMGFFDFGLDLDLFDVERFHDEIHVS